MPSKTEKQHRFMAAVANNPKFAKKAGVPQSVGEKFMKADRGRKFKEGGEMAMKPMKELKTAQQAARKETKMGNVAERRGLKSSMMESGAARKDIRQAMQGLRKEQRGEMKGLRAEQKTARQEMKKPAAAPAGMKKGGMAKYAKGGSIDGCATKGKTKGTMVKMAKGGMMKKSGCK